MNTQDTTYQPSSHQASGPVRGWRVRVTDARASGPPRVSVVIPSYNHAHLVGGAVQSVRAQTLQDWEAVIVDDGSTDETPALLKALKAADSRLVTVRQPNRKLSTARNTGTGAADPRAQFVMFLDSDDTLEPGALEFLVSLLDAEPRAAGAFGRARVIDTEGRDAPDLWTFKPAPPEGLLDFPAVAADIGIYPPSVCLFRRWAVDAAGPFDPAQVSVEDFDFYARVALHGPLLFRNRVVSTYRRHDCNQTDNPRLMGRGFERIPYKVEAYRRAWAHRQAAEAQGRIKTP